MATMMDDKPRSLWTNPGRWRTTNRQTVYDYHMDTYFVFALPKENAGSYHVDTANGSDDEMFILVNGQTGEIVGVQIDNFRTVWLKEHPDIGIPAWTLKNPLFNQIGRIRGATLSGISKGILNDVNRESGGLLDQVCPS